MTRTITIHETYHGVNYTADMIEVATTYKDLDTLEWHRIRTRPNIEWKFGSLENVCVNDLVVTRDDFDPHKILPFDSTREQVTGLIHAYIDRNGDFKSEF